MYTNPIHCFSRVVSVHMHVRIYAIILHCVSSLARCQLFVSISAIVSTSAADVNPCIAIEPCKNGGRCYVFGTSSYFCVCPWGFAGKDCQFEYPVTEGRQTGLVHRVLMGSVGVAQSLRNGRHFEASISPKAMCNCMHT